MVTRERVDLSEERRILAQMIVDTDFLREVHDMAKPELFESSATRQVAAWVLEYWNAAKEAPARAIEDIFLRKRKLLRTEEDAEFVGTYLQTLSKDWARWRSANITYAVRGATEYFKMRSLEHLRDQLEGALKSKNLDDAERLVGEYRRVEAVRGTSIQLLHSGEAVRRAFDEESEVLFKFAGALGEMIGPLSRGDFIAFQAPPKRGKSWWLLETAFRASQYGHKALFISLEMTEKQVTRRAWQRLVGQTDRPKEAFVPEFYEDGEVGGRRKHFAGVDTDPEQLAKERRRARTTARGGDLRLEVMTTAEATVAGIENMMDNLANYDGWAVDVLVVDYADLLAAQNSRADTRHQLDEIWKRLRGIAQKRNILVVTASQGGIRKVDSDKEVGVGDISEDARKIAHVTKLILLNQSKNDRKHGVMRVRCPIQREGEGKPDMTVAVLQCLDIGRCYLDSRDMREVTIPQEAEPS